MSQGQKSTSHTRKKALEEEETNLGIPKVRAQIVAALAELQGHNFVHSARGQKAT
jgi:hypothetical protein